MCNQRKKIFNQDLQIFSKEIFYDNTYGKRNYLATNYIHFFKRYKSMKNIDKCWYEVIREGFPCKLYFDIEYKIKYNKNINGDELIKIFKNYLIEFILNELNIKICKKDIIDLTSTTNIKFSRHLIILFPNAVFKNNQQCGIFVRKLCDEIRKTAKMGLHHFNKDTQLNHKGKQLQKLFIYDMDQENCTDYNRILFIDESVYSRNRCFRLIYSSKLKYIHQQKPSFIGYTANQERKIISHTSCKATFKQKFIDFMDTLICAVDVDETTKIIKFPGQSYSYSLSSSWSHSQNGQIMTNKNNNHSPFPGLDEWMKDIVSNWSRDTVPWIHGMNKNPKDINKDDILYDAKKGDGRITKWKILKDNNKASLIIYCVERNRYCMNIARCHKSNGIYFVVKIDEKIVEQKCFDPECRNFVSPPIDIPPYLLEIEDEDFEKKLIQSVEKIEKRRPKRHNLSVIEQEEDEDNDKENDDNMVVLSQLSLVEDKCKDKNDEKESLELNKNEWKTPNNSELMVDKEFELEMLKSTKIIEKTIVKTNDNDNNNDNNDNEPSYLLENDLFDEELLLKSCRKIEQDHEKKLKLRESEKESKLDGVNKLNDVNIMTPNPLIEKCLFGDGRFSDLSFSSKSAASCNTSLISGMSTPNVIPMSNKSGLLVKRNLNEIFSNNIKDSEIISPIKPRKRQKLDNDNNNNDDENEFVCCNQEWDDDFLAKIDKQVENVANHNTSNNHV